MTFSSMFQRQFLGLENVKIRAEDNCVMCAGLYGCWIFLSHQPWFGSRAS
jgi:hypothetical protein